MNNKTFDLNARELHEELRNIARSAIPQRTSHVKMMSVNDTEQETIRHLVTTIESLIDELARYMVVADMAADYRRAKVWGQSNYETKKCGLHLDHALANLKKGGYGNG